MFTLAYNNTCHFATCQLALAHCASEVHAASSPLTHCASEFLAVISPHVSSLLPTVRQKFTLSLRSLSARSDPLCGRGFTLPFRSHPLCVRDSRCHFALTHCASEVHATSSLWPTVRQRFTLPPRSDPLGVAQRCSLSFLHVPAPSDPLCVRGSRCHLSTCQLPLTHCTSEVHTMPFSSLSARSDPLCGRVFTLPAHSDPLCVRGSRCHFSTCQLALTHCASEVQAARADIHGAYL